MANVKNILITGANGYLGSYLIEKLADQDEFFITAFDLDKKEMREKFAHINNIDFYDTNDWETGSIPFQEIDIVVHCAFARANIGIELAKSLVFTKKIFTEAVDNNCVLINISSRSVYGQNKNIPWNENTQVEPDNLYALAKYNTELLLESIANSRVKYTNLRLAGLISPVFDDRVLNKLVIRILNNEQIKLFGGKQLYAYLDIQDAVSGIIAILNAYSSQWQKIYNLGNNHTYTLIELTEKVIKVARKLNIKCNDLLLEEKDIPLIDGMNCNAFYKDFQWHPRFDMETTIKSIFEYKLKGSR